MESGYVLGGHLVSGVYLNIRLRVGVAVDRRAARTDILVLLNPDKGDVVRPLAFLSAPSALMLLFLR